MVFKNFANFLELLVNFGEYFCHLCNGHRGAHACNDVLALSVGKEFAHKSLFTGSGITRKRNARAAVVAHITKRHHLNVYCGTPAVRDIVVHTVDICAGVVPRTEYGFYSLEKLNLGVVGEIGTKLLFVFCFKLMSNRLQIVGVKLYVLSYALSFLKLVDKFFKVFFAYFHNDVGEHLDKSSVAVPSPTGVARFSGNSVYYLFVQAEVEDSIHHTGHRSPSARTNGNEQRIFLVAELLSADFFHLVDVIHNFCLNAVVDFFAVLVVLGASLGRDSKSLRHGKTDMGHFRKVSAFTAQKLTHSSVALRKEIAIFFCHLYFLQK